MGNENTVHDFKNIGHTNLAKMAQDKLGGAPTKIDTEAKANGHDGLMPVTVQKVNAAGKVEVTGTTVPTSSLRGRVFLFTPTKEKVTVIRTKVGQNYNGGWVHEVTNREGKSFLAADIQLKPVK